MIFFSVIIPTYNRAHLICETIDSVLAQTYDQFEIIIVDDGSTDDTENVIAIKYAGNKPVRYFKKQNEERGAARNFGIKQAKGDYAVFFDSDDWMLPGYLRILNETLAENNMPFMAAARYNYNNNGVIENHPELVKLKAGWYGKDLFLKGNMLACNFCIRIKENKYRFFPEEKELASMEDWIFLLLNLSKEKIYISDKTGVTMRQHEDRSMMNNKKVIEARKKAVEWIKTNLDLSPTETKELESSSHYFCAIHQYLENNRKDAIREIMAAVRSGGLKTEAVSLFIKSIIGRKLIARMK